MKAIVQALYSKYVHHSLMSLASNGKYVINCIIQKGQTSFCEYHSNDIQKVIDSMIEANILRYTADNKYVLLLMSTVVFTIHTLIPKFYLVLDNYD